MWTRRALIVQAAIAAAFNMDNVIAQTAGGSQQGAKCVMKKYKLPHSNLEISRIGYGCAGLGGAKESPQGFEDAARLINTAHDNGITLFDHADIYYAGQSEVIFGRILKQSPGLRSRIVIQSKCGLASMEGAGIPPDSQWLDFSYEHILNAVEGSLKRLGTEFLDILLLHWPDALGEPDEIARAFEELHQTGKVRCFGVSNHTSRQIELLKRSLHQPVIANQIQLGLGYSYPIADGLDITDDGASRSSGVLDYCRLNDIKIQAYSPLRGELLNPPENATPELRNAVKILRDMSDRKNCTPPALMLAWLLRHPAGIIPIIGTTNPVHVIEDCAADQLTLSREEWYELYIVAAKVGSRRVV